MLATAPAPCRSVEINAGCTPDEHNPHSWLPLLGDPADQPGTRVLYGCLRPSFRGRANSAAAFTQAKLAVGAAPGTTAWTVTAARAEVLLPRGADDRFVEPRALMQAADAPLASPAKALLAYFTFTFDTPRLHEAWEVVRAFVKIHLIDVHQTGVLLVQHAPHLAASANSPHVHALVPGPRRLTSLGLGAWVPSLMGDKAHPLVRDAFRTFQANWSPGAQAGG